MELTVLAGDDDQAALEHKARLIDSQHETLDMSDGGRALVDAVGAPSLFGGRRVLYADGAEQLNEAMVAQLLVLAPISDALVVARARTLSPKLRSALGKIGKVVSVAAPRGRGVAIRIEEMAKLRRIKLGSTQRRILVERAGHDMDRVSSVLDQCAMAHIWEPSAAQVNVLVGSSFAPGVPWDLSDAIEAGNAVRALTSSSELVPVAAVAYLTNRFATAAKILEGGLSAEGAVEELKVQPFQADKLVALATKLGPVGMRNALVLLADGDRLVKVGPHPRDQFDLLVVKLCALVG